MTLAIVTSISSSLIMVEIWKLNNKVKKGPVELMVWKIESILEQTGMSGKDGFNPV